MDEQFKAVKSKICGGLSALKKLKDIFPQSQLCSVFHAIVEVIFDMQMLFGGVPRKQN